MSWRWYLLLAALGLALAALVAHFQSTPGYLDSDYYFAGGVQLAQGRGFTEPYLWNYLDNPAGLPHPSHTYWMPLASLVAAAGMLITGQSTFAAGRLGFILLAGLVPVATAALAYSFSHRRDLAIVSGLLAVFSAYYAPFLPVPDNYGLYLVLGAVFLLVLNMPGSLTYAVLGIIAGLLTLGRSDGLLWLGLTLVLIGYRFVWNRQKPKTKDSNSASGSHSLAGAVGQASLALAGFLIVTGAWFVRTFSIFGTLFAPGGGHLLWLTNYDQTFAYPASQLTFDGWLAQGWASILAARLVALRWNLLNAFAAQGAIFLLPFILIGIWHYRRDLRVQIGLLAWCLLLFVMTVVFPFAGYRGGFFHAGAAVQPLWWTLAPVGLDLAVTAARTRGMFTPGASRVFLASLVGVAVLMTAALIMIRVLPGWGADERDYARVEMALKEAGLQTGDIVMVRNPPGYYLATGQPAIVVPYSGPEEMWAAADRYNARFLVLEAAGVSGPIKTVYENLNDPHFAYLGELDGTRLFEVQH